MPPHPRDLPAPFALCIPLISTWGAGSGPLLEWIGRPLQILPVQPIVPGGDNRPLYQGIVDFLLVAGDVYDSADQNIRAQLQFKEGLKRLGENGIAAYIVRGNHDPDDAWSRSIAMPENAIFISRAGGHHPSRPGRQTACSDRRDEFCNSPYPRQPCRAVSSP